VGSTPPARRVRTLAGARQIGTRAGSRLLDDLDSHPNGAMFRSAKQKREPQLRARCDLGRAERGGPDRLARPAVCLEELRWERVDVVGALDILEAKVTGKPLPKQAAPSQGGSETRAK
jgi:hypothetical protein